MGEMDQDLNFVITWFRIRKTTLFFSPVLVLQSLLKPRQINSTSALLLETLESKQPFLIVILTLIMMEEPAMAMANAAKLECSENVTQRRFYDPAKLEPT